MVARIASDARPTTAHRVETEEADVVGLFGCTEADTAGCSSAEPRNFRISAYAERGDGNGEHR